MVTFIRGLLVRLPMAKKKTCTQCKVKKDLSQFRLVAGWRHSWCRECERKGSLGRSRRLKETFIPNDDGLYVINSEAFNDEDYVFVDSVIGADPPDGYCVVRKREG